jgi:hypothetical protein
VLLISFFLLGRHYYLEYEYNWYVGFIPGKIDVTEAIEISGQSGIIREGCGAAIFKLSEETIKEIRLQGLNYFDNALQGRGSSEYYYTYQKWQKTPVPKSWTNDGGIGPGLGCSDVSTSLNNKIVESAIKEGSYFTIGYEADLLVFPSLGIIVFTYFG